MEQPDRHIYVRRSRGLLAGVCGLGNVLDYARSKIFDAACISGRIGDASGCGLGFVVCDRSPLYLPVQ